MPRIDLPTIAECEPWLAAISERCDYPGAIWAYDVILESVVNAQSPTLAAATLIVHIHHFIFTFLEGISCWNADHPDQPLDLPEMLCMLRRVQEDLMYQINSRNVPTN